MGGGQLSFEGLHCLSWLARKSEGSLQPPRGQQILNLMSNGDASSETIETKEIDRMFFAKAVCRSEYVIRAVLLCRR